MIDNGASALSASSALASFSTALTRRMMQRLACSALPFCCNSYRAFFSDGMLFAKYQSSGSLLTHSLPLSWRTRCTLGPVRVAICLMRALMIAGTLP